MLKDLDYLPLLSVSVLELGALPRIRDELLTVELGHLAQDLLVVLLLLRGEVVVHFLGVLDLEFGVAARHAVR